MRALLQPSAMILLAANLVPLVGVIAWDWDAFVLLMLYWLETAVIAFWTIVRIATMPASALGELQIGGAGGRPASPIGLAAFFTLHAGIFMAVHFLFLWALFAGEWADRIHGVRAFVDQMVIGTGLWVPLLVLFVVRGAFMLLDAVKPWIWRKLGVVESNPAKEQMLGPGESIIFGLYLRIVVMQVTVIFGAWFAMLAGSAGALAFLVLVKTALELSFQLMAGRFHAIWTKAKAQAKAEPQP
jgi:Family of unknown function (DUF6498)